MEGARVLEKFSESGTGGYPVNIGIEETKSYDLSVEFASKYWDIYAPYGTVNTLRQMDHGILIENLLRGNIDWGITLRKPKRKGLHSAVIGHYDIAYCCSNKLFRKFKRIDDLLINIPFAESSWDKSLNHAVYQHLRENGISPKEKIYSDHPDFIKNLCQRGRCNTYIVRHPRLKYKGFKVFEIDAPLKISLYAVWKKKDEVLVSIKKLLELISSSLSNLPERYEDIELQIDASNISDELLK